MTLRPFIYENILRQERRVIFARNWPEAMAIGLDCLESSEITLMVQCYPMRSDEDDSAAGG